MSNPAWSHTALNAFETCPRRYYLTRVAKSVVEPQTEALLHGNRVHKAFELRLKNQAALPEYLSVHEPMVVKLMSDPGAKLVEEQIAITRNFTRCGWFDKSVWCRGVVDVGLLRADNAVLLDWKTGKRKPDNDQLKLFAGLAFAAYPYVNTVYTGFIWLKDNKIDSAKFTRNNVQSIWSEYLPRVQRLENAYKEGKWIPRPSGLCKGWCPVKKNDCEFGE